jgi:hypothetical protein
MKAMLAALLVALTGCVYTRSVERRPTLTVEDVVRMTEAGVDQGTQLSRIYTSRLSRPLTADDIIRLKNANVPDPVIQAMAQAAPEPVTVVESPYYVVEPSFGFHYYNYGYHPYRYHAHPRYPHYRRARPRYYHRP